MNTQIARSLSAAALAITLLTTSTSAFAATLSTADPTTVQRDWRTCIEGYVWREARPTDKICVLPDARTQAAADNRMAASRRDPNGAYGPMSCKSGFVWREAWDGDTVCVTPAVRKNTLRENETEADHRIRLGW
jgi:hypothetical protein